MEPWVVASQVRWWQKLLPPLMVVAHWLLLGSSLAAGVEVWAGGVCLLGWSHTALYLITLLLFGGCLCFADRVS